MKIRIRSCGRDLARPEVERIERHLRFRVTRYEPYLRGIDVSLDAEAAGPGGSEASVLVRLRTRGLPEIAVEDGQPDVDLALQRAVSRAVNGLRLELARRRQGMKAL